MTKLISPDLLLALAEAKGVAKDGKDGIVTATYWMSAAGVTQSEYFIHDQLPGAEIAYIAVKSDGTFSIHLTPKAVQP